MRGGLYFGVCLVVRFAVFFGRPTGLLGGVGFGASSSRSVLNSGVPPLVGAPSVELTTFSHSLKHITQKYSLPYLLTCTPKSMKGRESSPYPQIRHLPGSLTD